MGYPEIEEAVRQRLRDLFQIDDALVTSDGIDKLFDAMQTQVADLGILLEYGDGTRIKDPPFNGKVWSWSIEGYLFLRYEGDSAAVEDAQRAAVAKLFDLFDGDFRLGGITPLVRLAQILKPDALKVNDIPFYVVPFAVEALDKV